MTTKERMERVFKHEEPDRVPLLASPWKTTLRRWKREGMPEETVFEEYFGLDRTVKFGVDSSPRYEEKIIEETDEYIIQSSSWGTTFKDWKHAVSTPHFTDHTVTGRESWEEAKKRMDADPGRVDWKMLEENYKAWREEGCWLQCAFWFGFDVTHSKITGTERLLVMMAEDPELATDIFNTQLETNIKLFEQVIEKGFEFDSIFWWDDMGYRNGTFFSVKMYRDILKPVHKRAVDWAHGKGMRAHLHSCGNINDFLPELIDIGLDALNPLEVKAGMDPLEIKKTYGDKLVLHGGLNAMLWDDPEKIEEEVRRLLPVLKEGGGYIFQEDHSVPDSVSLEDFRRIIETAKELGKY